MPMTTIRLIQSGMKPEAVNLMLAESIERHLRFAPFRVILLKAGEGQAWYVQTHGCPGCSHGRCELGCRAWLFRRALVAAQVVIDTSIVPHGFIKHHFECAVWAWPGLQAKPLDGTFLNQWSEARLLQSWSQFMVNTSLTSVLLATSNTQPDPRRLLATYGWQSLKLPSWMMTPLFDPPQPWFGPAVVPFWGEPFLAAPAANYAPAPPNPMITPPSAPAAPAPDELQHAISWIQQLAAGQLIETAHPPTPSHKLTPSLAQLVEQLLTHPAFYEGKQISQRGLSLSRLQREFGWPRSQAEQFLQRLETVGALAEPTDPERPWNNPRLLAIRDAERLVALLEANP